MHDRPTASELLTIMAETLSDNVVPATEPHARHQARVAANLCRILARELDVSPATDAPFEALEQALGVQGSSLLGSDRLVDVASAIGSADDATAHAIHEHIALMVKNKLDVVKPGYDTHDAAVEAGVVR